MARVRTVFGSHASLAHTWAQQSFVLGYASDRRMFFQGDTIYSYGRHYAIARFTDLVDAEGKRVVLFKEDGYSVSTAKHRIHTRRALDGLNVSIVYVEDVNSGYGSNVQALKRAFASAAELLASPLRNRHVELASRLVELQNRADTVRDFAALYGETLGEWESEVTAFAERITQAMTVFNDPAKVEKREKARALRLVKRSLQEGALHLGEATEGVELWLKHGKPLEVVKPLIAAVQIKHAFHEIELTAKVLDPEADKVRHERRMAEYHGGAKPVTPSEWQEGKGQASQYAWGYNAPTLVRRKGDRLETSRGAEVPFRHAVLAYLKACECRRNGSTWHRNGEKVAVGIYQLDAIDAEGNIVAGCHTIAFDEMQRLALREVPELVRPSFPAPALIAA